MAATIKNQKSVIRAWATFDWANSAYNLVITSTIFPAYYTIITTSDDGGDRVDFFGISFINTALANYGLAVSYLLMVFLLPVLSSIADYKQNKKTMMKFFTYMGSIACMGLFFFELETLEWGIICSGLAAMGYIGGVMFNNSYLPEIASVDQQDRVSAKGFAYGYIGSVLLQLVCFLFVLKPEWFGIQDASFPARLSFLLVGVWWIGFAQVSFRGLPKQTPRPGGLNRAAFRKGFHDLKAVVSEIRSVTALKRFLSAFFFYAMGVQTIMLVAAAFGEKVLRLGASKLIMTILAIQLLAMAGAYLMSWLAGLWGNKKVLLMVIILWIVICISAYYISSEGQFYGLACLVGLVMGGTQTVSRSTFSKLIPTDRTNTASFFSFYDITEKVAIVIGLFSFGFIEELTGNIRLSALFLAVFFLLGLLLLMRMPNRGALDASAGLS